MLLIVGSGLLLSLLFSGAETALTSMGRLEVQRIMAAGGAKAKLIQLWLRDPGSLLVTVLVGNNISNIATSSFFALWANTHYPKSVSVLLGVLTFVLIIFAEIIPKLVARSHAVTIAPYAVRFLNFVYVVLWPIIYVVKKISSKLVLASGMPGRESRKPLSEDELTHTIEIATKEGGIDHATGEVLSNLIDFPDRLARDIMTPRARIKAVSVSMGLADVVQFVSTDGHSRFPVIRNSLDELVGVMLVKDLLAHVQKGSVAGAWTKVTRRPYFVSELAPLGTILRDMKRWGTHLALVRNETGVLTGLLTLEDLIEEIVGEIRDEHDDPVESGLESAMGGPRLVNGEIPILDFNDRYSGTLPIDLSYSTLNGYILSKTGGLLPPIGTLIFGDDMTFRIHSVTESGIATVEIIDHITSNE